MSDLNLTFGIELEFICVYPIDCFEYRYLRRKNEWKYIKPGKRFHNAGHALYYYLEEAGIPVNIGRARHGDVATFSEWQVMSDCLELSEQEERYKPGGFREEAIEIASRKLSFYGDDWHRELRKVLKVLAQIERRYGCKFVTNTSTGLHVHVGNNEGRLPLATIKRITQFMTAFESRLDEIHASTRVLAPGIVVPPDTYNAFQDGPQGTGYTAKVPLYAPLSFFHHAARRGDTLISKSNIFDWLSDIQSYEEYSDSNKLYDCNYLGYNMNGHRSALNLDNTYQNWDEYDPAEPINTIEFRQHIGTLDFTEIVYYITLLAHFTHFCHLAPHPQFLYLMIQSVNQSFGLPDLLATVGCEPSLIAHFHRSTDEDAELGLLFSPTGSSITSRRPSLLTQRLSTLATPTREAFHSALLSKTLSLQSLIEQNDYEQTFNSDIAQVQARQLLKFSSGYYGLRPDVSSMPFLSLVYVEWMFACALAEFRKIDFQNVYAPEEQAEQAVLTVLEKLAEMYGEFDPERGSRQPAVMRVVGQWEKECWRVVDKVVEVGRKASEGGGHVVSGMGKRKRKRSPSW